MKAIEVAYIMAAGASPGGQFSHGPTTAAPAIPTMTPTTEPNRSSTTVNRSTRCRSRTRPSFSGLAPKCSTVCQDWNFTTSETDSAKDWISTSTPNCANPKPRAATASAARLSRALVALPPIRRAALRITTWNRSSTLNMAAQRERGCPRAGPERSATHG